MYLSLRRDKTDEAKVGELMGFSVNCILGRV